MAAVEIILLVCGIICIVVSIVFDFKDKIDDSETITTELTEEQKTKIRSQINQLIDEELDNLNERTEASLDKISNTKTLELNDYAESILGQINRNHNETVFLYDMLNEKAKEVKNTVRDVNVTKRQVEKMHATVAGEDAVIDESLLVNNASTTSSKNNSTRNTKDLAKERLTELVRKSNEKSRTTSAVKDNQANDLDKLTSVENAKDMQLKTDTEVEEATADSTSTAPISTAKVSVSKTAATKTTSAKTSTGNAKEDKPAATKTATARTTVKTTTKASTAKTTSTRKKKAIDSPDTQPVSQEAANMNIQFEKGANNNDKILRLFNMGISNKDIAKQLNLGVGEVKLVIDLYNGGK